MWQKLARLVKHIRAHDADDRTPYVAGGATLALLTVLFMATMGAPFLERVALTYTNVAAVVSAVLVELSNKGRAEASVPTLQESSLLKAAAQAKADDMAQKGYFAHFDTAGKAPWDWIQEAGYTYKYAGENLAVQFTDSEDVVRAWLNSPAHRQNLLDTRFTEVGIALSTGMYEGRPTVFVVQMFGTPLYTFAEASVASSEASEPEPAVVTEEVVPTLEPVASESISEEAGEPGIVLAEESSVSLSQEVAVPVIEPVTTEAPVSALTLDNEAPSPVAASVEVHTRDEAPLPWWARFIASPWSTVRFVGALMLALFLAFTVYLVSAELRQGHLVHASAASVLYLAFGLLFVAADVAVFQNPAVPAGERVAFIENTDTSLHFVRIAPQMQVATHREAAEANRQRAQVAAGGATDTDVLGILTWLLIIKKGWMVFVLLLLSAGSYVAWQRYRLGQS